MNIKNRLKIWNEAMPAITAGRKDAKRRTKVRTNHPDQIANAGLIGLCLLFIVSNLGQRPDEPLSLALSCCFIALPGLVLGYVGASFKTKGRGKLFVKIMRKGVQWPASISWIAVVLALFFAGLHYSRFDGIAFVGSIVVMGALTFIGMLVALNREANKVWRAQTGPITAMEFVHALIYGDVTPTSKPEPNREERATSDESDLSIQRDDRIA